MFLIFLIAAVKLSMECETQESESGYTKRLIEFILTQNVHV